MPNQEPKKSYKFFAPKVFIRTFGWPFVSALQRSFFVLFSRRLIRLWRKDLMNFRHRLLGQAAFVVFAPFRLTVVRLHSTLAWSLA
jgi:hypothetical protein